jgi:hypothetical protein
MHTTAQNTHNPGVHIWSRSRRWRVVLAVCLITGAAGSGNLLSAATSAADICDKTPTGVTTSDYFLDFTVPAGLMPDPQFDGRPAKIQVHRLQPVYSHGKCPEVAARAAVLIHGRSSSGPDTFDLRHPAPGGGTLSVQEGLARAGIDTFAPNLLGYSPSTTFDKGLDDPGNASLRPFEADGTTCLHPEGCDRTHNPNIFPLDRQGTELIVNPLAGQRRAHSNNVRFARGDVWVRDIRQVIDDAIARAQPTDGKVTLVGYSLGAVGVGRTLYAANSVLPGSAAVIAKVNRVAFAAPFFGGPTEETTPPGGFVTFPLTVTGPVGWSSVPPDRDTACTGRVLPRAPEQLAAQTMEQETLGRDWGGDDPDHPTGLRRLPTFSTYGWNAAVAGQLTPPTLVIQGLDDIALPGFAGNAPAVYNALPASMTNKVLVQVGCGSHQFLTEGCSGPRCQPATGTPYGEAARQPWSGPHTTFKKALIEWITSGTFNGAAIGKFKVDDSGVVGANPQ